jgi:hypothetical protein
MLSRDDQQMLAAHWPYLETNITAPPRELRIGRSPGKISRPTCADQDGPRPQGTYGSPFCKGQSDRHDIVRRPTERIYPALV